MPIEADILLAQSVQEAEGSVSALGMGWQVRPPEPVPWAIALILRASRDLIGTDHSAHISLERGDGEPVSEELLTFAQIDLDFVPEGRTDAGLNSPVVRGFGFNLLPVLLDAGTEFLFRLWIDGETRDHWAAHFRTTPP